MPPERLDIDHLIRAVADGTPVDWPSLVAACRDAGDRELIAQFQVLAELARATAPVLAETRSKWGSLQILDELGRGASGRVFRARDPRLDREVAVKLFDRATEADGFVREAQLLARVRHPNVVVIHGGDSFDGTPGLWMELVRGRSLRAIVEEHGPLGPREAVLIGLDLCAALAAVHGTGIVHRDIKANNVMRETGGRIVLMDFGEGLHPDVGDAAAAITTGTPLYMAPELFDGTPASVSTDLYALGVLLFFLVTGGYPVTCGALATLRDAHRRHTRRLLRDARPDVPAALAQVVDRALSPRADERFRTAADMEQALAATLGVHGSDTVRESPTTTAGWRQRVSQPLPAWLIVAAVAIAVAATMLVTRQRQPASAPKRLTPAQWEVVDERQTLAGSFQERGEWTRAAEHYQGISDILQAAGWQDEPFRAHILAKLGWAQVHAGAEDKGRDNLALALYKLAQEAGPTPLRATIEMAVSVERYRSGDPQGAAAAMMRALEIRRRAMISAGIDVGATPPALDVARLTQMLARQPPDEDQDGDWLPDAIERTVGLDPTRTDSNADGVPDDEEDTNGDGLSNSLEWGIVADPTRVLAHFGSVDPEREGFRREYSFEGVPAPSHENATRAWRVTADRMGFYSQKLTPMQKRASVARGWRLLSQGALRGGLASVVADLGPAGPRFDQTFFTADGGVLQFRANAKVVPLEGEPIAIGSGQAWPAVELAFEPSNHLAKALRAGRRVQTGYRGHQQFQEDMGLFWGSNSFPDATSHGQADFGLILLQIR